MRRGAEALEFALTLPVFLVLMGSILEYGWYFHNRSRLLATVHDGCRLGAVVDPSFSPSPVDRARTEIVAALGRRGYNCAIPANCNVTVAITQAAPNEHLTCRAEVAQPALTGWFHGPGGLVADTTLRLELQR